MILPETDAKDFARYIAENKPYLIEIEEEVQKLGGYGEMDIKLTVRGGMVEKIMFWRGRSWLRDKAELTQSE